MNYNDGLSLSPSKSVGLKPSSYLKNRSVSSSVGSLMIIQDEPEMNQKQIRRIGSYFDNSSPSSSSSQAITSCSNTKSDKGLLAYANIKEDTKNFMGNNQSNGVNLSTFKTIQCQSTHIKYTPNSITKSAYKDKPTIKKINLFIEPMISILNSHNQSINSCKNLKTIENHSTIEIENLKINEINTISETNKSINSTNNTNTNNNANDNSANLKGKIRRYASMDSLNTISTSQISRQAKSNTIDLEDIMPLEEKHRDIVSSIINNKSCKRECLNWWKYYFNSTLKGEKYEEFFSDSTSKIIIHTANNLELFSVMLCYYISEDTSDVKKYALLVNSILTHLHLNAIVIFRFIVAHIGNNCKGIIITKSISLEQMKGYLKKQLPIEDKENKEKDIVAKVKANCTLIVEAIRKILINYKMQKDYEQFKYHFNNLSQVTNDNLNDFFVNAIMNKTNARNRLMMSSPANRIIEIAQQDNKDKKPIPKPQMPFLPNKRLKSYTLVLDLDETLINTKVENCTKGLVIFRPGLNNFLLRVKEYYELVLFTAATQDYAEPILQMIEGKEKLFDYKLFSYHTVQCGKTKIKDLTHLGRDLSTVIIVDNVSLCFKLQKANGILIKSFYGHNEKDIVLNDLLPILIKIAKDKGDVRQSIIKYKSEILTKISPTTTSIIDDKRKD